VQHYARSFEIKYEKKIRSKSNSAGERTSRMGDGNVIDEKIDEAVTLDSER
jgi:hypothetical protein